MLIPLGTFERGDHDVSQQFGATADNYQARINPFDWPLTRFLRPTLPTQTRRGSIVAVLRGGNRRFLTKPSKFMTLDGHSRRTTGCRSERGMPQKTMLNTAIFCQVKMGIS